MNKKGFTLIELMIVVAIIGILAAVAIPKFAEIHENSKRKRLGLPPIHRNYDEPQAEQKKDSAKFCPYCGHSLP